MSSNQTTPLSVRLLAVMEEFGTIDKGGYNSHSNYKYVKEADVARKFQELLVKHRVFVFSSIIDSKTVPTQTSSGKSAFYSKVVVEYTFVNVDQPEERHSVQAVGEGMDTGDKAIYKAITGAHKYMLIRNFNLGSDEDAEKDSPGESRQQRQQSNGARPASAQPTF